MAGGNEPNSEGTREGGRKYRRGEDAAAVSRRSFIRTLGLSAAASSLASAVHALERTDAHQNDVKIATPVLGPEPVGVTLRVNGQAVAATIDPATTLMEALRINLGLTGTKEICDRGACGGCSVLVDDRLINSCMMLALDAVGSDIVTIESLARGDTLDPVQEAFIRHDALQCGFCTPGLILAATALLKQHARPTLEQIKHGLSGNICRCGTYTNAFNAVLGASAQKPVMDAKPAGNGA